MFVHMGKTTPFYERSVDNRLVCVSVCGVKILHLGTVENVCKYARGEVHASNKVYFYYMVFIVLL